MARLVAVSEQIEGKVFDLNEDKLTIGRLPDNTIRIEENSVSGHHAVLTLSRDDYSVRDLNSTNGTRVNGQKVVEAKLINGDILTLGHVELRYESDTKKNTKPLPPPRKGIDLSETNPVNYKPPKSFSSASPFKKRRGPEKLFQYSMIGLGVVLFLLIVVVLIKLIFVH